MAKPIKETPVLVGKDAQKFSKDIDKSKANKISLVDYNKMKENFKKLHAITH